MAMVERWAVPNGLRALSSTSRDVGRSLVGDIPWGAHFCLFYETKEDLVDAVAAFLEGGLRKNEFCMWAISEPLTTEEAASALRSNLPDFDRHVADGRIEVISGQEWFFQGGQFDANRVIAAWEEKLQSALKRGFSGMRATGNAFWLGTDFWEDFRAYENDLQNEINGKPVSGLCTYPLSASTVTDFLDVAHAHGFGLAIRNGEWEFVEAATPELQVNPLTRREREVLTWVARGKSAWEIGEILAITKRTVDEHVQTAARKLSASNRTQAVAIALRDRLIDVGAQ